MSSLIQVLNAAGEVLWFATCASHAGRSALKCVHRFLFSFFTSIVIAASLVASAVRFSLPSCFEIAAWRPFLHPVAFQSEQFGSGALTFLSL